VALGVGTSPVREPYPTAGVPWDPTRPTLLKALVLFSPSRPSSPPLRPPPQTLARLARERESPLRHGSHGAARLASRRRDQTRSSPVSPVGGGVQSPPPAGADPKNPKPWRGRVSSAHPSGGSPAPPWRPSTAPTWSCTRRSSSSPTYVRPPSYLPWFFFIFFSREPNSVPVFVRRVLDLTPGRIVSSAFQVGVFSVSLRD
jgi:hypothetical protein